VDDAVIDQDQKAVQEATTEGGKELY